MPLASVRSRHAGAARLGGLALFSVAYLLLSRFGLEFISEPEQIAVLWPASGLALALLVRTDRTRLPERLAAIFLAGVVAQLWARSSLSAALLLSVANTAEPLLAAWALRLVTGPRLSIASTRGIAGLAAAAILANGATALLGAAAVVALYGGGFFDAWRVWWLADGLGMLTIAPIALLLPAARRTRPEVSPVQLLGVLTLLVGLFVFVHDPGASTAVWQRPTIVFPFLIATAVFAGPRTASYTVAALAALASLATLQDLGPFASPQLSATSQVEALQAFIAVTVLCTLMVSAVVTERRRAEQAAREQSGRLASVLRAATHHAVTAVDGEGRITLFNQGAERMLGIAAEELVGRETPLRFHDPVEVAARMQRLGLTDALAALVHGAGVEGVQTTSWTYVRGDGSRMTVSVTVTPMHDDDGVQVGHMFVAFDITDRRAAELSRETSERRYRQLVATLPDATVLLCDRELRCLMADGPGLELAGLTPESAIGRTLAELTPPEQRSTVLPLCERALSGMPGSIEYVPTSSEGVFLLEAVPFLDPSGAIDGVYVLMRDVSEQRRRDAAIRRAEADLRTIFDSSPVGNAIVADDLRVLQGNAALERITGSDRARLAAGMGELVHPDDVPALRRAIAGALALAGTTPSLSVRMRRMDGREIVASLELVSLGATRGEATRVLVQVTDATARTELEQQLRQMADHDPLTGLLNRRRFAAELNRHAAHVARYGAEGAVVMLDVDRFKHVNDTFGHAAGDELIIGLASVLKGRLRDSDTIARLGGDEFAVLLPRATRPEAERVARDLVASARAHRLVVAGGDAGAGHEVGVSVSVGVAMFDGSRAAGVAMQMLANADRAMYTAKAGGRDSLAFAADIVAPAPMAPTRR